MKNRLIVFFIFASLLIFNGCSSSEETAIEETPVEKVNLTVEYSFAGIENGYDHQIKMEVYSDGEKIGETPPHQQSETQNAVFEISKGNHTVKLIVLANFNSNWEEHLKSNDYSIDASYVTETNFITDEKIKILFDLDKGAIREYN